MASDPVFAVTPKVGLAQVSAANTSRDGTGTIVDILTGGTSGTNISKIEIVATGTTTAGVVRLYLYDGTNTRLLREVFVTAATPSTTVSVWNAQLIFAFPNTLHLPSNSWKLQASTHNAETFNVFAFGADL